MKIGGLRISISALMEGIYDFQTFPHFYPKALVPFGSRLMLGDYSLTFSPNLAQQDGGRVLPNLPHPKLLSNRRSQVSEEEASERRA